MKQSDKAVMVCNECGRLFYVAELLPADENEAKDQGVVTTVVYCPFCGQDHLDLVATR